MGKSNVCIIIVTYNGITWIDTCLSSCGNYPVIVVDNASTDDTVSYIERNYSNIIMLKQTENLGFGQANNVGIRYALDHGFEHVFLLNQDAYLVNDVLDKLITFQNRHPEYGILSPIHITGDQKKLDKNFSNYMLREKTSQFYSDFVLGNPLAAVYDVPFVNAAAWLVSKTCIKTVGGFDPLFFHYGEDENYCQRVLFHGFKIGVLPEIFIVHDREDRTPVNITAFSPEYYINTEKTNKIVYANINVENTLDLKIVKLKKKIFKLQLKMKFKRVDLLRKELVILLKINPLIKNSRTINKTKGPHYL